jgi:hypothetical protein
MDESEAWVGVRPMEGGTFRNEVSPLPSGGQRWELEIVFTDEDQQEDESG